MTPRRGRDVLTSASVLPPAFFSSELSLFILITPPLLIWTPFLGSVMGLLVWLMHCDLRRPAVYLLRVRNEKKRGGALVFGGKPEPDKVKPGHPEVCLPGTEPELPPRSWFPINWVHTSLSVRETSTNGFVRSGDPRHVIGGRDVSPSSRKY